MEENQKPPTSPEAPKTKKKGFIRWEAIVPAGVIIALVGSYFILFFDGHLRGAMEFVGYKVLGAEVNVASVHTSFRKASLHIQGIQLTNADKPSHNLISVGDIRFDMSWDALLRGKILIEIAAIDQIQFDSARRRPGRVKPPEPKSDKPSFIEKEGQKLAKEAIEKTQEQYGDNVLGDMASLLAGGNAQDQLKNLESQLQSKAVLAKTEANFKSKQSEWQTKMKSLPQQKDLELWSEKFKKVKTKNFSTPQELQDSLNQFQTLLKEADGWVKQVDQTGKDLNADLKAFETQMKDLESAVQGDIDRLESHFKIPKLDAKAITRQLFQRYTGPYLAQIQKYQNMAQQYLPPGLLNKNKDDKEDIQIQPRPRERGISYEFGRPNSYPMFWMKKARISSKATPGNPALGNLTGEALNISSNQVLTGLPIELRFKGDFPELAISGIDVEVIINHTKRPFREMLNAKVGSYPVEKKLLVSSKDIEIGFAKAVGTTQVKASFSERQFDFSLANAYQNLDTIATASNQEVDAILKTIMKNIPQWTINASGSGVFPDIPIDLNSNLGPEFVKGFKQVLDQKINEAKAKVKAAVDEAVAKEKAKLETEVAKAKSQVESEIKKLTDNLNKQKADLQAKIDETKKEESKKIQKQLESEVQKRLPPDAVKKLDELKKKIKF